MEGPRWKTGACAGQLSADKTGNGTGQVIAEVQDDMWYERYNGKFMVNTKQADCNIGSA